MLNRKEFKNGYIEFYSHHEYAYNYTTGKGQIFQGYSISEIKRKLNLK